MRSISIRFKPVKEKEKIGYKYGYLIHDFRQHESIGASYPKYINPEKVKDNKVIYLDDSFKGVELWNYYETRDIVEEIQAREWEKFLEVRKLLGISKRKSKYPFNQFIFTFSVEAQKAIQSGEISMDVVEERVKDFFLKFTKVFGVRPLYLVLHLDETAPHFHGVFSNYRHYEKNLTPYKDLEVEFALNELELGEYKFNIYEGIGQYFSTSFKNIPEPEGHVLPLTIIQDSVGRFFAPIGLTRGLRREEREARGEPYWKWIHRSVKRLHYDLPMEISLKEKELEELSEKVKTLMQMLKESTDKLKKLLAERERLLEYINQLEQIRQAKEKELYSKLEELKKQKLKEISRLLEVRKAEVSKLEREIQALKSERKEIAEQIKKYRSIMEKIRKSTEELEKLKKQRSSLEQTIRKLESRKEKVVEEIRILPEALKISSREEELLEGIRKVILGEGTEEEKAHYRALIKGNLLYQLAKDFYLWEALNEEKREALKKGKAQKYKEIDSLLKSIADSVQFKYSNTILSLIEKYRPKK